MNHQESVLRAIHSLEAREGRWHSALEITEELGDYWQRNRLFSQRPVQYTTHVLSRMYEMGMIIKKPRIRGVQPKVLFAASYEFSELIEPAEEEMSGVY